MRIRNVKNKEEILNSCEYLITNGENFKGNWSQVFSNNNKIYLEIGMGKGKFIQENALANPDINYIGIEKFDNVLALAIKKMPKNIPNLKIIRMDALNIDKVFSNEIDLLYLNFSDPWPKKRWHNRRLTSKIFLDKYDCIFKNSNKIDMRTDNEELFIYSIESLSKKGYILSDISFNYHKTHENIIMSEYEIKFDSKEKNIYHLFAQKEVTK